MLQSWGDDSPDPKENRIIAYLYFIENAWKLLLFLDQKFNFQFMLVYIVTKIQREFKKTKSLL